MNPSTAKALERALRALERSHRPRRRFTLTPLMTALGLALAYILLTILLPRVWSTTLPGGLETATRFQGWPGLIWRLAVVSHQHFVGFCAVCGAIFLISILLTRGGVAGRFVAWLLAVSIVLLNGLILYVTIRVPVEVVMSSGDLMPPTAVFPVEESAP